MHVLLLNQYYPPDTAATAKMAALIAETLAARHHVTVLAARPSYDPAEYHPYYLLRREQHSNLAVERVGSTAYSRFRMRRRVANYLSYLALAVPRALAIRADVILAMTDPPIAGLAGALVARLRRKPFVYNIRDLYPDMALGGDILRAGWFTRLWERLHRWALRQAARVIVLGEDMRERIIAKGVAAERVVIVRDGAPIPDSLPAPDHPVTQQVRCGFPFVLLHAGNLGFYGAWETLLAAARNLYATTGACVGLVFVGEGAARQRLESVAVTGTSGVRFLPFRPASEVPYVLAAGDMHVVTIRRGLEGVVVPSKMYPILAAGRPILAVAPEASDVARIVRRTGCGITADPDDPESVVRAVKTVYHNRTQLAEMARRAREAAREYDRVSQLAKFMETLESLGANR